MNRSITISEPRHRVWKKGTFITGGLTIIFGILFWNQSDPLWAGIFRLVAFIFFSLTVFGLLKRLESPISITIKCTPEHLLINYRQKEKVVREERFEQSGIEEVIPSAERKSLLNHYLCPHSATLKVRFNDGHRDLHLFEYRGRTLFFNRETLQQVQDFLEARRDSFGHPEVDR